MIRALGRARTDADLLNCIDVTSPEQSADTVPIGRAQVTDAEALEAA